MLRLTSRASELFLQQPAAEQRRLLQTVLEKAAWKDAELQAALFEPFEILRHSNQERYRKEMEKTGSGRDLRIWLAKRDFGSPRATLQEVGRRRLEERRPELLIRDMFGKRTSAWIGVIGAFVGSFLTVVGQTDRPLSAESQGSCTRRGENKAPSADARTQ